MYSPIMPKINKIEPFRMPRMYTRLNQPTANLVSVNRYRPARMTEKTSIKVSVIMPIQVAIFRGITEKLVKPEMAT